jgi:DUF1707 SHOCT-like domain
MAREVNPRPQPVETMRAADADRHQIADHLKAALDEGRLTLGEYDDRVRQAYAARTYAELMVLVTDLPAPGLSASEVQAKQDAERRREARRLPTALAVLWTIWAALAAISVVVWVVVGATAGFEDLYFWPAWMAVPGVALGAVTIGVQNIRSQQRRR